MMRRGEKAFTIAELLVTIAIIALLAVMVVPVFEARSEEARTLTCQSNMQKVVSAIRLYMADHDDTLPPTEHRPEVLDYFTLSPGTAGPAPEDNLWCAWQSNPYLRWPVLLESYVRRDVWQCPSAAIFGGAKWIIPGPDWFAYVKTYESLWADGTYQAGGPCFGGWPTGWGGTVTDSIMQRQLGVQDAAPIYGGAASGAFIQSIGTTWWPELTLGEVADAGKFVIAGDAGVQTMDLGAGVMAYPEICALECGNCARW
ncbi:MAG TPA: type II secretion system protein, partial [Armatimonadota bacterium]|nr:type II secretion system protein [Armatimonadota bacterium]